MIYARALTEVFQNGEDPRNGSAILQKIRNRSYHSVQGFDVCIADSKDKFWLLNILRHFTLKLWLH